MKIGYCVEGSTDAAVIEGLRERWCPQAELVPGKTRGAFRRREIPKVCLELRTKGVDVIVLLRDANKEAWRDVADGDRTACKEADAHLVVVGVCDRNIECWLVAEPHYASRATKTPAAEFQMDDPKSAFSRAMGITGYDQKKEAIAQYVRAAPLHAWLANRSFEHFYDQLWQKSKELGCQLENLRDARSA